LAATAAMTMLMYLAPRMGLPKMDIPGMLGSMFTSNKGTATGLGMVLHFMMGVIFALIYALVWSLGIGSPTWIWGLIFGALHAVGVIVVMPVIVRLHPRSPEVGSGPRAAVGILMAHLLFGLVVALVYAAFVQTAFA